jgi:hypothetical protein
LPSIRKKTFTEKTILSAWQKTGLFPFDIKVALKKIKKYKEPIPELPSLITEKNTLLSILKSLAHS